MNSRRSRRGTVADRGKVLEFPPALLSPLSPQKGWRHIIAELRRLGPGFVTGAADVDPSLVITATVAGAAYRYNLLWVVLLCIPFLWATFAVSGRIGYQTRLGLVDLLRQNYGREWAFVCAAVIVAINLAMIVADLMAVSDALSIILVQKRAFFVAATAFTVWYILIFRDYRKITRALVLLALPLFVYVASAILAAPSARELLVSSVRPHISRSVDYVATVVALFGSLLTPYILVWQTSSRREQARSGESLHQAESHAGTFVTTLLCYSIIVAAGTVLHLPHPVDMSTRDAAAALQPAVGKLGEIVFALGIIGAGLVALPVLVASMCYAISEAMGWPSGLSEHPWEAKRFYVLISAAMFIAASANFLPINPVKALFWSQILAGILTVPILLFLLRIGNDRRVMCSPQVQGSTNQRWQNFWVGAAAGGLVAAAAVWAWWATV